MLGIDGEGKGRKPHLYTLLAIAGEGKRLYTENERGLSSKECLSFIARAPVETVFAFSFGYDQTMIFKDLPNESIYKLLRPEYRRNLHSRKNRFNPVEWEGFHIDLMGTQLVIREGKHRTIIWDVFKFFQSSFVNALKKWKVGSPEEIERIQTMKLQRSDFENIEPERKRNYCFNECEMLGNLVEKLTKAHEHAGLTLDEYHGAGSTAGAVLSKIKPVTGPIPKRMGPAVFRAYFGGRFENGIVGYVRQPIYNYDISSAYPYQLFRLPCLEHAYWEYTHNVNHARAARAALVHWRLNHDDSKWEAWGTLPFRTKDGNILFPIEGGQGWTWGEEFFAAQDITQAVEFVSAWCLYSNCNCRPFQSIPHYYRERCRLGKDAAGIVLKLGVNACYGKIAQTVGSKRWSNRIWAGIITSNTRAQILRAMLNHHDSRNLLAIATDGVYTLEKLNLPEPEDTGTFDLAKPLGGWEEKVTESGMFFARPGINFPLDLKNPDDVKGRGFGRKALYDNAERIMRHWDKFRDRETLQLPNIPRFYGAKTSIWRTRSEYKRSDNYAAWYDYEPQMSFSPLPKRVRIREDNTLQCHRLSPDAFSETYLVEDPEAQELQYLEDIENEQPF